MNLPYVRFWQPLYTIPNFTFNAEHSQGCIKVWHDAILRSFGYFLSNSQASWDEKRRDYFLTKKALSEIPKGNLHFERSRNRAL